MASFFPVLLLPLLFSLSACHYDSGSSKSEEREDFRGDSAAEISRLLQAYNLPQELLPVSLVTQFEFNKEDASFVMRLERSCYAKLENDYLWYGEEIKGRLRPGRIENISGLQSKMLVVWLPVRQLHVDDSESGYVYFEVGPGYKKLSSSAFQSPLPCSGGESLLSLFLRDF